jgi:hypothetical protein
MRTPEPRRWTSWTLAPVHQVDIDRATWSSRHGNPHAYPSLCAEFGCISINVLVAQIWFFCVPAALPDSSQRRMGLPVPRCLWLPASLPGT